VSRYSRRVARIKRARGEGLTGYRLPDGRVQYIRSKNILEAFCQACQGIDSPGARTMLAAVDCVTQGGGLLHELAQASKGPDGEGPTIHHQPTQKEKTQ
jgi:hypothetical protein